MNHGTERTAVLLALQRAAHRTLQSLGEELAELGLTPAEINVLANLADGRERTVAELSAAAGSRSSTLTGVLDRLERRQLIRRQPHPTDRRSVLVVLTDPGATMATQVHRAVGDLERRLLAGLTPRALDGCRSVLAALAGKPGEAGP